MCFNQTGDISTLNGSALKLDEKFNLGSSVSSTKTDIDTLLAKSWAVTERLSIIWKSDLTDKMKHSFFQAAVLSILLYRYATWTLTKRIEKKLDGNYNKNAAGNIEQVLEIIPPQSSSCTATDHPSWKLSKLDEPDMWNTAGDELISDVLLWTPLHSRPKAGRPPRTNIHHVSVDMEPAGSDGRYRGVAREGQGCPCW